ncbi:MAG: hypothetical protein BM564_12470 [Bacteroidetes bacterium MedPE-SWsnd-G2]|nr:MAG: hypothetical protein BM564_12470 [Bacteroidetes bacterium MedPE-SWsnd-G2]
MPDRVTFEYAIIRVVPRVEREEFINVGAIVYSKRKKFLGMQFHLNQNRISGFCNEVDIETIENYLKAWDKICQGGKAGGPIGAFEQADRFRWIAASKSTIIQCSKTHPGMTLDPQKELEDLMENYVL